MNYSLKIKAGAALLFCSAMLTAQTAHKDLRQADKAYQNGNFPEAELGYRKAIEKDNSIKGNYNLGNTTYRQEHYDESIKHYQAAAEVAKDRSTKARAYHNLGNALYKKGQYKESVEAYKNALRQNPNDIDTKRNLTNALRRLPPPQQQDQQNDKKDNKDKDKQNQENQQQKDSDQSPDQNQDQNQKQKSSGQKEQPQDLNKQEAKELLEIMDQEEQKVQQKLKKAQAKKGRSAKDW